ncbi:PREDICTED: homologous-pairing protein 2 homolog [Nipponia nippon]|uniref:homologous-pairing protein 2 homolog n=1 Tax=Nipponia nippon TaxID=128390 RepID=UPI0005110404|nr:PREDICTED: homologous-pairing protein 2 homolog [Nipponia nippon]
MHNKSGVRSARDRRSDRLSIAKDNLEADLRGLMRDQESGIGFPQTQGLGLDAILSSRQPLPAPKMCTESKSSFPAISSSGDAELRGLDGEIAALSAKVQALQQSCRQMETELRDLNSSMTTPEMAREVEGLRKDCASYAEKLERIKSAANHVTPEEKEKVCSEQKLYCKEWRRRKRMATELLEAILEGYPKSKKQFFRASGQGLGSGAPQPGGRGRQEPEQGPCATAAGPGSQKPPGRP